LHVQPKGSVPVFVTPIKNGVVPKVVFKQEKPVKKTNFSHFPDLLSEAGGSQTL